MIRGIEACAKGAASVISLCVVYLQVLKFPHE